MKNYDWVTDKEREAWERYFFVLRMLLWILQNAKFNRTTEEVNQKHEAVRVELHRWFDGGVR